MAKRRLAKQAHTSASASTTAAITAHACGPGQGWDVSLLGISGIAAMLMYTTYSPCDSTEVEHGAALWFCAFAFVILGFVGFFRRTPKRSGSSLLPFDLLDAGLVLLPCWMVVSTWGTSSFGNLRLATNETWVWIAGGATLFSVRRLASQHASRRDLMLLILVIGSGLAVDGIYQNYVTLPETRAAYRADPEQILAQAGVLAPANSSLRMVFENRLFDGGPSATFALANSFAAFLVFAFAAGTSILRAIWTKRCAGDLLAWITLIVILFAAILATRSRSALVASAIAVAIVMLTTVGRDQSRRTTWLRWMVASLAIAMMGLLLLAVFGNGEWFSAAPASLRFRLEYWHSTALMVADRPWFGCGPGNFQSVYDQYRSSAGTEQIADPHNFFFETLGSGGLVAAGLLILTSVAAVSTARQRPSNVVDPPGQRGTRIWWGAGIMLIAVWMSGLMLANLPDFDAHKFAIPLAIGLLFWLRRSSSTIDGKMVDHAYSMGLITLMIHLTTAGGWTIPGISILIWISVGILCRVDENDEDSLPGSPIASTASSPIGLAAVGLLLAITLLSIRPVAAEKLAFARVESAQEKRQARKTGQLLETAVDADAWAIRAPLYRSDFLHWQRVAATDSASQVEHERWLAATIQVEQRCGQNPGVYRHLLTQAIHLYQVTGERVYVDRARRWCAQAMEWSPSNQWLCAQYAEIEQALGNADAAKQYAEQANRLSKQGDNLERAMWLQMINVVEPKIPEAKRKITTMQGAAILADNMELSR